MALSRSKQLLVELTSATDPICILSTPITTLELFSQGHENWQAQETHSEADRGMQTSTASVSSTNNLRAVRLAPATSVSAPKTLAQHQHLTSQN